METQNPEIKQTKSTEDIDGFIFKLRVTMAAGVAPERLATLFEEIESGQRPNLSEAQKRCRTLIEENYVAKLQVITNLTQPLVAALERNDLTTSELVFLNKELEKCISIRAEILASADNVYPTMKMDKH